MNTIQLKLSPELLDRIDDVARREGRARPDVIRRILQAALPEEANPRPSLDRDVVAEHLKGHGVFDAQALWFEMFGVHIIGSETLQLTSVLKALGCWKGSKGWMVPEEYRWQKRIR